MWAWFNNSLLIIWYVLDTEVWAHYGYDLASALKEVTILGKKRHHSSRHQWINHTSQCDAAMHIVWIILKRATENESTVIAEKTTRRIENDSQVPALRGQVDQAQEEVASWSWRGVEGWGNLFYQYAVWDRQYAVCQYSVRASSLMVLLVKNLLATGETWVQSLGWEDTLENSMTTHSGILAWRIPWTV